MNTTIRTPIPKWDGKNPAKTLKPWLKELRIWRQETAIPTRKHGMKLQGSFENGSWMKTCADRIPEEVLVTELAWDAIMKEISNNLKLYLDVDSDVIIEDFFFTTHRDSKETMWVRNAQSQ